MQAREADALAHSGIVELSLSYDAQSEVAQSLSDHDAPRLVVGNSTLTAKSRLLRRMFAQPADTWRLVKFCRKHSVDVIYEVMDNPLQLLPRAVVRLTGVRVLVSVHDAVRHHGEESLISTAISAVSLRHSDGIITYSASVADSLRSSGRVARVPVFVTVHGAFGVARAMGQGKALVSKEVVVGFFGRIESYKGLARLALAISKLQDSGVPVRLAVHGRGQLNPHDRVLLVNARADINNAWVSEDAIQTVIESFDVLALPYEEASQSGVVGYALSAGIPIVCTPVGGLREQVHRSGGGLVAAGMSASDFAVALHTIVTNTILYRQLSQDGIVAARTIYSWEQVANDISHAAESVLKRGKKGAK